jgi:hypothetical protein
MDAQRLRACQEYKENVIIDLMDLTELYARFSQSTCQHCAERLILPTAEDDIGLWFANDRYSITSESRSMLKIRCQSCRASTGACSCIAVPGRPGCLLKTTDNFGFCLHILYSNPYEGDIPRLFALWCVSLRIELHFSQSSHGESLFKTKTEVDWDFLVTGSRGHKLESLLQLLEDLINARPSDRRVSPVEISILRSSSILSYIEGILESACAAKFARSETHYSSVIQFLTVVVGDSLLRKLIFEPRLRTSYGGGLLPPAAFATHPGALEEHLTNVLVSNIERLYRELLFYDKHRQSVTHLRWDMALPGRLIVQHLYAQLQTTNVSMVIKDSGRPLDGWPWGIQFSWDNDIIQRHKFSELMQTCPNFNDTRLKGTGILFDRVLGFSTDLPPGVFVKASTER